jgi:hypothetical protein
MTNKQLKEILNTMPDDITICLYDSSDILNMVSLSYRKKDNEEKVEMFIELSFG